MRIIAGKFRGSKLLGPGKAENFRPTADKTRQALFNILESIINGPSFLDLYAGSGAVGLEALSRRYNPVWLVENNKQTATVIRKNIAKLTTKLPEDEKPRLFITSVEGFLAKNNETFHTVFCDPPYDLIDKNLFRKILLQAPVKPGGLLIVEHEKIYLLPEDSPGFDCFKKKHYGRSALSFYRKSEEK